MLRRIVSLIFVLIKQVVKRLVLPAAHPFRLAVKTDALFTSRKIGTEDFLKLSKFLVLSNCHSLLSRSSILALSGRHLWLR
jgi:hypothetical protein